MGLYLNNPQLSDHAERYKDIGFSSAFLENMAKVVAALKATEFEPYDQLTGYVRTGNEQYITRFGSTKESVTKRDMKDINIFLKHYKDHT